MEDKVAQAIESKFRFLNDVSYCDKITEVLANLFGVAATGSAVNTVVDVSFSSDDDAVTDGNWLDLVSEEQKKAEKIMTQLKKAIKTLEWRRAKKKALLEKQLASIRDTGMVTVANVVFDAIKYSVSNSNTLVDHDNDKS